MQTFISIGECMLELSHTSALTLNMNFAGDTLNTALYLARYADQAGVDVFYATAIGKNDPYSLRMLDQWENENINTCLVQQLENKLPGLYFIETNEQGERKFYYYRKEAAARDFFYQNLDAFENALFKSDYIHFSGITLGILDETSQNRLFDLLTKARANGAKVCFDSNYRPALFANKKIAQSAIEKAFLMTDIAYPTFDDQCALFGDKTPEESIARLKQWGASEIVVKDGENGCVISNQNRTEWVKTTPIPKSNILDTSAAGDSFNAGYLVGRLQGLSPEKAAGYGHRLASVVIQNKGAIISKDKMPKF